MEHLTDLAPGFRTRVLDDGTTSGDAVPLVLLHGTPFDADAWDPLLPLLAGRRVVRFDARGHGVAAAVPVADYRRLAADVVAVLDHLDMTEAHVVGHSWGGETAQRVAVDHPDRVARLSLLCTRASPFPPFTALAATLRAGGADLESMLGRWFTDAERAEPDGVAATVRRRLRSADPQRWAEALEMIGTFDDLGDLAGIPVPVDVVAAELDGVSPPEHMTLIADAVPSGALHVLAGARHLVPLQRPEEVARLVLAPRTGAGLEHRVPE
ncbi:alpha/beta fold hydrolase [Actinomycetospora sp. NBC_00405]|uniref:alpha/beta fold hydrolase n=1 Tax=Actinomycetospora sp. NBC_00405 TaxID=2975952 RepID=UPI002E1E6E7F